MQAQLLDMIMTAYNGGWLQYHPFEVFGIRVEMTMYRTMNKLTMSKGNKEFYTMLYDSDLYSTTESGVAQLLALVI